MRDDTAGKKSGRPARIGAVDELVRHHEIHWLDPFLHAPAGRNRNDGINAKTLEFKNIRPVINLTGRNMMPATVTGQEDHISPVHFTGQKMVRWRPERSIDDCEVFGLL